MLFMPSAWTHNCHTTGAMHSTQIRGFMAIAFICQGHSVCVRGFHAAIQSIQTGDSPVSGSEVRTGVCVCVCVCVCLWMCGCVCVYRYVQCSPEDLDKMITEDLFQGRAVSVVWARKHKAGEL